MAVLQIIDSEPFLWRLICALSRNIRGQWFFLYWSTTESKVSACIQFQSWSCNTSFPIKLRDIVKSRRFILCAAAHSWSVVYGFHGHIGNKLQLSAKGYGWVMFILSSVKFFYLIKKNWNDIILQILARMRCHLPKSSIRSKYKQM